MNFFEEDIIKCQKMIKELEENPGQKLKSHKIKYQKRIEMRREQIEAQRQGKPMIDAEPLAPTFFRAMGFVDVDRAAAQHPGIESQSLLPKELQNTALMDKGRALGLPVDTACGEAWKYAVHAEIGNLPLEGIITCEQYHCPPRALYKLYMIHRWPNQPFYHFDIPPFENESCLEYLVDQLHEFIEYAEWKYPGVIKYDENKLIELLARENAALSYNTEIYEMCKHKPSPIAGRDLFDGGQWYNRDPEFLQAKRDEVAERLAKGIVGAHPWEEKLRVVWSASGPNWMEPDQFEVLGKWGLAFIGWFASGVAQGYRAPLVRPAYYGGRKLTPLEDVATRILTHIFGGTAAHYVDNLLRMCRDLKIDAIIDGQTRGGTCTLSFKGLIAERAEKELGIPTLYLEFAKDDPGFISQAEVTAKLDEFAQICLSRKGLA